MIILRAGHARCACEVSDAVMSPAAGTHRSNSLRRDAGMSAVGISGLKAGEDVNSVISVIPVCAFFKGAGEYNDFDDRDPYA